MLQGEGRVLVFTREQDRGPFTFQGEATADHWEDTEPVTVWWRFPDPNNLAEWAEAAGAADVVTDGASETPRARAIGVLDCPRCLRAFRVTISSGVSCRAIGMPSLAWIDQGSKTTAAAGDLHRSAGPRS
jgi:hypothetical protein